MGWTGRESADQDENRYSPIQGVSAWDRHGLDRSRIGRPGRESVFSDSGGVRGAETWVESAENRQTGEKIDILRFKGCQYGLDMGQHTRESPDQDENRYFTIQGVSGRGRHRLNWSRIGRPGQESIFRDSGGVSVGKTQVRLSENRQNRENIDIPRFRGCRVG